MSTGTTIEVPTIGRTVLYQLDREQVFPAIVARVLDPMAGVLNLAVLTDSLFEAAEARHQVAPGQPGEVDTWHWPERA